MKKWVALMLVLCMVFALSGVVAAAPQKDGGKSFKMPPGQQKKIDAAGDIELKGKVAEEETGEESEGEETKADDEADENGTTENENRGDKKPALERKHHFKDKVIGPPAFVREMQRVKAEIMEQKKLKVCGRPFESELPPVIKDGRVLIPIRAVANGLKADVDWNSEERKITITKGEIEVTLYLEDITFYVNGEPQELDVPAMLLGNNRTFVPLRFIAVALGEKVDYDPDTGEVIIGDDEEEEEEEEAEEEGKEEGTTEGEDEPENPDEQNQDGENEQTEENGDNENGENSGDESVEGNE